MCGTRPAATIGHTGFVSSSDVEWFDQHVGDPIEIHEPRAEWAAIGARWEVRLADLLSPLRVEVDHVGSTAVPGLAAKPIIDLQVQVPDLADESAYVPAFEELGMVLRARGADFRFFRYPKGQVRNVHVHVCGFGSRWAAEHIAFRDALRQDVTLAREYEQLKLNLAEAVADRAAYNLGKEPFIRGVVARLT